MGKLYFTGRGQGLFTTAIYLAIAISISTALLGLFHNEPILVESGFKVFITTSFLKLVVNKLKGVLHTANIVLALLLLFYISIINEYSAALAYIFSCILVLRLGDINKRSELVSILINWYIIATSHLYLLIHDMAMTYLLIFISLAITITSMLKTMNKHVSIRDELSRRSRAFSALANGIYKANAWIKHIYKRVSRVFKNNTTHIHGKIADIVDTSLRSATYFEFDPVNPPRILITLLETSKVIEEYINSIAEGFVFLSTRTTIGLSNIEKGASNMFHTALIYIEKLQHEVERALVYLLSLMSILLLIAIILYAMSYAR
ncbi:MAG: hypothetical protein QXS23_03865 [Desulfurococcaceae archaeon]